MREIKFRAWYHWAWDPRVEWFMSYSEKDNAWNLEIFFRNVQDFSLWVEVMQYTWLKDNNWKEIYEGDYVKGSWDYIWEVIYDNDFLQYRFKNWRELDYYWLNKLEIIWNIYENPLQSN
jgi:hypothetical protein